MAVHETVSAHFCLLRRELGLDGHCGPYFIIFSKAFAVTSFYYTINVPFDYLCKSNMHNSRCAAMVLYLYILECSINS